MNPRPPVIEHARPAKRRGEVGRRARSRARPRRASTTAGRSPSGGRHPYGRGRVWSRARQPPRREQFATTAGAPRARRARASPARRARRRRAAPPRQERRRTARPGADGHRGARARRHRGRRAGRRPAAEPPRPVLCLNRGRTTARPRTPSRSRLARRPVAAPRGHRPTSGASTGGDRRRGVLVHAEDRDAERRPDVHLERTLAAEPADVLVEEVEDERASPRDRGEATSTGTRRATRRARLDGERRAQPLGDDDRAAGRASGRRRGSAGRPTPPRGQTWSPAFRTSTDEPRSSPHACLERRPRLEPGGRGRPSRVAVPVHVDLLAGRRRAASHGSPGSGHGSDGRARTNRGGVTTSSTPSRVTHRALEQWKYASFIGRPATRCRRIASS